MPEISVIIPTYQHGDTIAACLDSIFSQTFKDIVIFCDADLILKPKMLHALYDALKANPKAAYAYGGFRFGLGRFKALPWSNERLRKLNYIHTSALIRREDFVGFDESIKKFQDRDMWLSMS